MFNISIVDDDKTILLGLKTLILTNFPNRNVNVATYLSPKEANEHKDMIQSDLIISDITMGHENGLDFIKNLKEIENNLKVIIISAHQNFEFAQKSIDLQVHSYMTKPIDFNKMLQTIESLLNEAEKTNATANYPQTIQKVLDYLDDHYGDNITLKSIADNFHYNPSYLGRSFNKHMDKSFNQYLQELRIKKAKQLLVETNLSIDEISYIVGFPYTSYFSKIFKETTTYSPLKYRKQRISI